MYPVDHLEEYVLAKNWNRQDIFIDNSQNISKNTKFRQTHLSIIVTDQAAPATAGNGHLENTISGKVFDIQFQKIAYDQFEKGKEVI